MRVRAADGAPVEAALLADQRQHQRLVGGGKVVGQVDEGEGIGRQGAVLAEGPLGRAQRFERLAGGDGQFGDQHHLVGILRRRHHRQQERPDDIGPVEHAQPAHHGHDVAFGEIAACRVGRGGIEPHGRQRFAERGKRRLAVIGRGIGRGALIPVAGDRRRPVRRRRLAGPEGATGAADRIAHILEKAGEMAERGAVVAQHRMTDPAGEELRFSEFDPAVEAVCRDQPIGVADQPVRQRAACENLAFLRPAVAARQLRQGGQRCRRVEQDEAGRIVEACRAPPPQPFVPELGRIAQRRRHARHGAVDAGVAALQGDAGGGQRGMVGIDARQHPTGRPDLPFPDQPVEAGQVIVFRKKAPELLVKTLF